MHPIDFHPLQLLLLALSFALYVSLADPLTH
jgi:hypothetical protein